MTIAKKNRWVHQNCFGRSSTTAQSFDAIQSSSSISIIFFRFITWPYNSILNPFIPTPQGPCSRFVRFHGSTTPTLTCLAFGTRWQHDKLAPIHLYSPSLQARATFMIIHSCNVAVWNWCERGVILLPTAIPDDRHHTSFAYPVVRQTESPRPKRWSCHAHA